MRMWIIRHARAIIGIAIAIGPVGWGWIWRITRTILDFSGWFDVLENHLTEGRPTWLRHSMNLVSQLPGWVPYLTAAIGLSLIYWDFQRSLKRVHHASGNAPNSLSGPVTSRHGVDSPLKITVAEREPYFATKGSLYNSQRTFKLRLENIEEKRTISSIKVYVMSIEPQSEYFGPWTLFEGPSLPAGDHVFIPLVSYGEARDPSTFNCADSFMTVLTATNTQPMPSSDGVHFIKLRVTGVDVAPCDFECRVWVGENGLLRIADAAMLESRDIELTLPEAARIAYERTLGTLHADMAERMAKSPDDVINSYMTHMATAFRITGERPPSTVREFIPTHVAVNMRVFSDNDGFGHVGDRRPTFRNLRISYEEMSSFISYVRGLG